MASALPTTSTNERPIFLYGGFGAEAYCVAKAKQSIQEQLGKDQGRLITVDASFIVRDLNKQINGVIFPGGNASHMHYALEKAGGGAKKVKDFVDQGGSYIGFCAGCYLAGPYEYLSGIHPITFEPCILTGKDKTLNLTSHQLKGPAIDISKIDIGLGIKTAQAVSVTFGPKKKKCHVFWNGGGAYSYIDPNMALTFADYLEGKSGGAGFYASREGKSGPIVLCNVHPEIQLEENELPLWCPEISKDKQAKLVADVPLQKEFLAEICRLAELIPSDVKSKDTPHWMKYYGCE